MAGTDMDRCKKCGDKTSSLSGFCDRCEKDLKPCGKCGDLFKEINVDGLCKECQEDKEFDAEHLIECSQCGCATYDDEVDEEGRCEGCTDEEIEEEEEKGENKP